MIIEEVNQLLEPGYLQTETGYFLLPNGHLHVAVLTRMPGCKGKMVDWWFGYMGDTEKYRMWHPKDHYIGEWDEHWRPGHYIGASHIVQQDRNGKVMKGRAHFVEPSEFFDTSRFEEAKVGAAMCANTYNEEDIHTGHLIHFVRDTDFVCEARSRFWMFHGDESVGPPAMKHSIEEMGYLADFLPELYAKETGDE